MNQKRYFQLKEMEGNVAASEIAERVIKSLLGTKFVEADRFKKLKDFRYVGRTFFADRIKSDQPINDAFIRKFSYVCADVMHEDSDYDPVTVSSQLEQLFRNYFGMRADFLRIFNNDDLLRTAKESAWNDMLTDLFREIQGKDTISWAEISFFLNTTLEKLFLKIREQSKNTFFECTIKDIEREIGYPQKEEVVAASINIHNEKDRNYNFDQVYKEYRNEFEEDCPQLWSVFSKYGVEDFIKKVMQYLDNEKLIRNTRENIASGVAASILRTVYFFDRFDGNSEGRTVLPTENDLSDLANDFPLSIQTILSLVKADTLSELSMLSNKAFFRKGIDEDEKSAIAFAVLAIYFTDLYIIISRYPQEHADMIKYKTNADVCRTLPDFTRHVSFSNVPVTMDTLKRRICVCLNCDEANAHKAAALFVNEFERALSGFEDIFAHIDIQIYYIKASVHSYGQDKITNHNFEAYTPTLMPLLSGGHLYSTNLVFIRELIQNAIDSISVRKQLQNIGFDTKISISLLTETATGRISSFTITDNGMGMGKKEIERYLTSIGRSYYTAGDFRKLDLSYRPISSFGIGFLSCFLVCLNIDIKTHSVADGGSYQLSIPNIEGCFFIEETEEVLQTGTRIEMAVDEVADINIYNLLEYAWMNFLDISYDLSFSWTGDAMVIMRPEDKNKRHPKITHIDLAQYARQETQDAPCPFAFVDDGVLLPMEKSSQFQHQWWNRYIRKQYSEMQLVKCCNLPGEYSIPAHAARCAGEKFFLFLPFQNDGDVTFISFDNVSDTFQYDYGMFITDLPLAGIKMRSKENGLKPYSGKLRILNAGILVHDANLESLFGENMRIYENDQETAYNDVIINFPPDWVELNVAREKIVRISPLAVNKIKLLTGIATSTIKALNHFLEEARDIPVINIQEIASFITVVCNELNSEGTGKGRELLTALKRKKFLLMVSAGCDGIHYEIVEDNGEDMNMKPWFANNLSFIRKQGTVKDSLTEEFFHDFEVQLGKKRVVKIRELCNGLAEQYSLQQCYIDSLNHNLALVIFTVYLCYFPDGRIEKYSTKAAHSRLALERQLMKEYSAADFSKGKLKWVVTYQEVADFINAIPKTYFTAL